MSTVSSHPDIFLRRHNGPRPEEVPVMAKTCGFDTLNALVDAAVPAHIRLPEAIELPAPLSESEALHRLKSIAAKNQVFRSYIGTGYYDTITPPVIQRNILENPGWYTPYTPYQAEVSQGRLEGLLNFQTMVTDLTAMDIANASMLDEATACAEAMMLCHRIKEGDAATVGEARDIFLVADDCHPQNIDIVRTRAHALGLKVVVGPVSSLEFGPSVFGALIQHPATDGKLADVQAFTDRAHAAGALAVVATDLLALTLIKPPGELGADVVVGNSQRFGVPLGFGGPHAAFFSTKDAYKRQMPGRLVGVSKDARGKAALRLSLGTREQHIRRDKATSNICTAQALLANMAMAYACYHGPAGLKGIAQRVHELTSLLATKLGQIGIRITNESYFDTLTVVVPDAAALHKQAEAHRINLRKIDAQHVGISLDECATEAEIEALIQVFNAAHAGSGKKLSTVVPTPIPSGYARTSGFLKHAVFNRHRSETDMLRYLRKLESRDISLCHSMIPLGSCSMKLNATAEMFPVSWPEIGKLHPFAPWQQTLGYQQIFEELESWLAVCTGFAGVSLQPNAGSQGEYAGLLIIRAYHEAQGQSQRNICLIPTSAHGTNPASAVMAGLTVVAVACDKDGNIDVADLKAKAEANKENLSALMITYPSTHGVFETTIIDICKIIHDAGGQVYMDGANMSAQVGLTSPAHVGADVCHLNLHKTFCIPHGGGGPGVGPVCVAEHLVDFLPGHAVVNLGGENPIGAVSAAPWGSSSICVIPWMYIQMMGAEGLTEATKVAILSANYISAQLQDYFPTLYRANGLVAHECILDLRQFKKVTAEDVAKRLMDYGFHAPTLSWPVANTLMVEPTESEPMAELDRFCEAMITIHAEIMAVEEGSIDAKNNPLKNAPHTTDQVAGDKWDRPYSREQAAFPVDSLREYKFWPAVARIDNVFGDRNLVCSCVGMEAYTA
ncbi:MAG TPA: aminomethyl-transferring glycine dehydrogenase [Candidatus Limnocylindria bacterium]|nr:aminomethyl-transferring glycine dehydrogenase [Candidatus Limnocylindria bacterium]